ncbi:universal stress protein [Spirosoma rigui]|uniref:universal stress protein n=1 Tax=Spirosoma rigui TaxID=564064 RepID=UPI0009B08CBC|nr:universal stress protein [Spirosoma rigui]
MKKIIVPTDFSDEATKAVSVAAQLCRLFNADLHVIHVLPTVLPGYSVRLQDAGTHYRDALGLVEEAYDDLLLLPFLSGLRVHTHVLNEAEPVAILDDRRFASADLLVMSSTGTSGIRGSLLGSNAEHLIRHAKMPVLVLKNPPGYLDLKTVVFASDFNDHYASSMDFLKTLLDGFDYPLVHLLFVNTLSHFVPSHQVRERMQTFVTNYGLGMCTLNQQDDYDVETGLLTFATDIQADLIVLGTHGRRGIRHLLQGSVAETVANHASMAVLTLPLHTEPVSMVILEGVL